MGGSVGPSPSQFQPRGMFACFIAFNRYRLKQICSLWRIFKATVSTYLSNLQTYPWIVESDPVLDSVAKSFKAQVGKVIEIIDHAYVLPSTVFLL